MRDPTPELNEASGNLQTNAHKMLTGMILARRLRGGETIIEAKLADLLGTSRTPLREALQRLEGEGLVVKQANRSFVVRNVSLAEYLQSLKVRELMEGEAASLAAARAPEPEIAAAKAEITGLPNQGRHTEEHWSSDDRVHRLCADQCGNSVMARAIEALRVTTRLFEIARLTDRVELDASEHADILASLAARDPRQARRAMQAHIRSLYRFALVNVG